MSVNPIARYDGYADWYDKWVADPALDCVAQSLLQLIGRPTGERILDMGCGQGRIARELADAANAVVGVDLSRELLSIAQAERTDSIEYIHGDVCTTAWWDGVPFDGAISSMALMDIGNPVVAASASENVLFPDPASPVTMMRRPSVSGVSLIGVSVPQVPVGGRQISARPIDVALTRRHSPYRRVSKC